MKSIEEVEHRIVGKEVILDIAEWDKLIRYEHDLKEANRILNEEIKKYNKEFATKEEEQEWQ